MSCSTLIMLSMLLSHRLLVLDRLELVVESPSRRLVSPRSLCAVTLGNLLLESIDTDRTSSLGWPVDCLLCPREGDGSLPVAYRPLAINAGGVTSMYEYEPSP